MIGQYAHGNEPSHHMAYLYNFINKPHKTQEKVHQILTELYTNSPDGIAGNEDCGQMSAWYIFSSLGFYPVTPGSNNYIIGTPLFDKATINLENGKQFTVSAEHLNDANIYIASATLNGKTLNHSYISHDAIMKGGILHFKMTNSPSHWATQEGQEPKTEITEHIMVSPPYLSEGHTAFKERTTIALKNNTKNSTIFYSINNTEYQEYRKPFDLSEPVTIKAYSELNGEKSNTIATKFIEIDPNLSITLDTQYANQYNAGGNDALIDGILGTQDFRTGTWQGYFDNDLVATVDLGSKKAISKISINFLQDQRSWIFYPTDIECFVSTNGIDFNSSETGRRITNAEAKNDSVQIKTVQFTDFRKENYRYVKIVAKKLGELPEWHLGYKHDGRSWLFVDEISIK
uniref:glycoside hydrolase domain-containing protein n=1 Tax=Lacinutrix neustonica TaxID=2980107 RepID=UPI0028BE9BA2|nr:glycoside hydrolase domain-containing protein [Lacinutrix neustonica]